MWRAGHRSTTAILTAILMRRTLMRGAIESDQTGKRSLRWPVNNLRRFSVVAETTRVLKLRRNPVFPASEGGVGWIS
jgi:hypothetical protein